MRKLQVLSSSMAEVMKRKKKRAMMKKVVQIKKHWRNQKVLLPKSSHMKMKWCGIGIGILLNLGRPIPRQLLFKASSAYVYIRTNKQ